MSQSDLAKRRGDEPPQKQRRTTEGTQHESLGTPSECRVARNGAHYTYQQLLAAFNLDVIFQEDIDNIWCSMAKVSPPERRLGKDGKSYTYQELWASTSIPKEMFWQSGARWMSTQHLPSAC